jgi:hypothetical protein
MNIKTKYNLGQFVVTIMHCGSEKYVECKLCNATGRVLINSEYRTCPDCYGRCGNKEWVSEEWRIVQYSHIGKISIEKYGDKTKNRTYYMINSTGIGSGTCWYEKDVFLSNEEAQKECNKRNEKI